MTRQELPEGWKEGSFPHVAEINSTNRNPANDMPAKSFRYIDISSVDGQTGLIIETQEILGKDAPSRARRVVQENDVIISTVRPYLRGFTIIPKEYSGEICSTGFAVLSARSNTLPQYLYHFVRSNYCVNELTRRMKGAMYPAVNVSDVKEIEIPLPPLEEQRQIVAILEQAEELRRLRAEADRLTENILPSAFIEMFGDPRENPKGWETVKLGKIAEVKSGNPAPQGNQYFEEGEYPFVRVQDLGRYGKTLSLTETTDKINDLAVRECRLSLVPAGSILFPKSGMSTLLNHRALLGVDAYVVSHLAVVTPKNWVLAKWLYFYFYFLNTAQWTQRTTLPSLRLSTIKAFEIPLPPLGEQQHFAELVEELQVNQQRQTEARKILDDLYQSLSVRAFTGELTAYWREEQKTFIAERQMVILAMLSSLAQRNRRQVLITALMKYLFLLQIEGRARELYRFVPYKYGPFAKEVYDDLEALKNRGLITIPATDEERERTEISLQTGQEEEIEQLIQKLPEGVREDAEGVIDLYGELSLKDLLDHVYAEYPEYAVRSER